MIGGVGTTELIVILVIVLIIFGAGRLPEVGSALGKGIRNFRRAQRGEDERDVTPETRGDSGRLQPGQARSSTEAPEESKSTTSV